MSRAEDIKNEMAALDAERARLRVVDDVLLDMTEAGMEVHRRSDSGDEVAKTKSQYGFTNACSTLGEFLAAGARWRELNDRYFDERRAEIAAPDTRVRRSGIERSR